PGLLDRHGQLEPVLARALWDVGAELLVYQNAGGAGLRALVDRLQHALEDQSLGVGDPLGLLGRRISADPEHVLLERPSMVERKDVELPVVSQSHLRPLLFVIVGVQSTGYAAARWSTTSPAPRTHWGSRKS